MSAFTMGGWSGAPQFVPKVPNLAVWTPFFFPIWNPYAPGALEFWFDASQLRGYADGDAVGSADDLGPKKWQLTQTGAARPTFSAKIQNGLPGVLFASASSQYLANTGFAWLPHPLTIMVLFQNRSSSSSNYNTVISRGGTFVNNTNFSIGLRPVAGSQDRVFCEYRNGATIYGDETGLFITTAGQHRNFAVLIEFSASHGMWISVDGYSLDSNVSMAADSADGSQPLRLGAPSTIAGQDTAFDGYIFEACIWSKIFSPPDRLGLSQYVKAKWGMTL